MHATSVWTKTNKGPGTYREVWGACGEYESGGLVGLVRKAMQKRRVKSSTGGTR